MGVSITDLTKATEEFGLEVQEWLDNNSLTKLPEFSSLHNKNIWGEHYRLDQIYYETVADFKSKFYGVKNMALYMINEKYSNIENRNNKKKAELLLETVDNQMWNLNNYIDKAKQRLKFYENITYVIGNVTYGSF